MSSERFSPGFHEVINATSAPETPLLLLEITHPDLDEPIRVVNDTQDLICQGKRFVALGFRATLPDDQENQLPRARLSVDNVGRELTKWLEISSGGLGAECRMLLVLRSAPDLIEWDITMTLSNVSITPQEVTADLGFEDLLNRPAIPLTYRPDTAPGLFA